ncbi:MAG: hypothetical protein OXB97_04350 [Rhodospirillales bacterium]|nr:hypothetical protein [Rhodospirillales bacterium]
MEASQWDLEASKHALEKALADVEAATRKRHLWERMNVSVLVLAVLPTSLLLLTFYIDAYAFESPVPGKSLIFGDSDFFWTIPVAFSCLAAKIITGHFAHSAEKAEIIACYQRDDALRRWQMQ